MKIPLKNLQARFSVMAIKPIRQFRQKDLQKTVESAANPEGQYRGGFQAGIDQGGLLDFAVPANGPPAPAEIEIVQIPDMVSEQDGILLEMPAKSFFILRKIHDAI